MSCPGNCSEKCDGSCKKDNTKCPLCGMPAKLYKYHDTYSMCYDCMVNAEIDYSHHHPCTKYYEHKEPTPRKNS